MPELKFKIETQHHRRSALGTTKVENYDGWVMPFKKRVKQAKGDS
jgi:hypothetical protein